MRLNAYVLAGDPAWAAHSLRSYYELVDRVFVSFDNEHRSWTGLPLDVERTISVLQKADPDRKLVLLPGRHSSACRPVLEVETEQRQAAIDAASDGAQWVLQLDTDEVMLDPRTFMHQLQIARTRGAAAMHYPLRDFYRQLGDGRYLEHCGRFWTAQAAYPGPLALKAGSTLSHCRQTSVPHYRVDVSWHNTDPWHPADATVHAVIRPHEAVAHLSWVRTESQMARKAATSGYAEALSWPTELRDWRWRGSHPYLTALVAPLQRNPLRRFRISELPIEDESVLSV